MLAGPSGSGKTTLLSILGCVLKPTAGEVHLCGEDDQRACHEADLPRIRTAYIGFIFQGHNLIASLTATQNIVLQLELRGIETARPTPRRASCSRRSGSATSSIASRWICPAGSASASRSRAPSPAARR